MSVGKPGNGSVWISTGLDTLGTVHMDAVVGTLAIDAHKLHLLENHAQVNGAKTRDVNTAIVGHQRTGDDKGTGPRCGRPLRDG